MVSPTKPLGHTRSSLSPEAAGARPEGRTPPPAPSSAYAKRAWQMQETDTSGEVDLIAGGYRRGRAGTLPSSFQAHGGLGPIPSQVAPQVRTSALSPAYPAVVPATNATAVSGARPPLRHTTSSSADLDNLATSRLRSGSLTLPENGLGNGSAPFGNGWLGTPGINSGPSRSPLGQLMDTNYDTTPTTDDINSTLDYLGLADGSDGHGVPEMRSQAHRAMAQSGHASRNRASTVSNFTRSYGQPSAYHRYDQPSGDEELSRAIDSLGMYDEGDYAAAAAASGHFYATAGIFNRDPNRPRSTTLGTVNDNPVKRAHSTRRAGYLASIPQSPVTGHMEHPNNNIFGYNQRTYSERDLTRSRESSSSRGPRHSISSHTSRTGTPDFDKTSATPQMPTRSLWIGNLDVNATSDALFQVFSPYGAIESVRLLPEKTCAFVNFMDRADAVRARDDVLNRMGGQVGALSETAPVRIGFGKIDSAPNGPSMSTVAPAPPGLVFTNGSIGGAAVPPPVMAAAEGDAEDGADLSALPTRAVWIGNIPGTTSSATLLQIFSPFGPVESARVLMAKCCGFVNFERLDSAVAARSALNGYEVLGSDVGPVKIGYARVQTKSPLLGGPEDDTASPQIDQVLSGLTNVEGAVSVSTAQQLSADGGGVENYRSPLVLEMVKNGVHEQVLEKGLATGGVVSEQQMIMQVLSAGNPNEDADVKAAAETRPPVSYYTTLPPPPGLMRRSDVARLKELRRRLDSGQCTLEEINSITVEIMGECAELASDYIGNTVIQKLFERCSPELRYAMLERVAPHLASIGVHKNGTWAAQKIIECSITDEERYLITSYLRPFGPSLMCDSLGNYVCAGTLRFGAPYSEYVFDAMIDRMWDIAQNRFGARCMRTCLESPHTSMYQKKRISTGIILNSIPLATNPNGALLLTWLVEQSSLNGRYALLANRFAPHIAHLCTHKLASLTVLRIITQTSEPGASTTLTNAIFTSPQDQTLFDVLSDANNGAQVIGKLLAVTSLAPAEHASMVEAVRRVMPNIKASSTPPYRVLLEAVGLPVPASANAPSPGPGPGPRGHGQGQRYPYQQQGQGQGQWGQQHGYQPSFQQYGGFSQNQNPYQHQQFGMPQQQMNLSPLLVPQNMPLGQMRSHNHHDPHLTPMPDHLSPRTPVPGMYPQHGQPRRQFSGNGNHLNQMMSPTSDPFNPFASPSIDSHPSAPAPVRLSSQLGQNVTSFEPQPNVGGLGIGAVGDSPQAGVEGYQSLMGGVYEPGPAY